MFNMQAFADELEKIAAHTVQKCRTGSMPIRVHNLLDKEVYDRSATKTADAVQAGKGLLSSISPGKKSLVTGALAIGAYEAARRANQDRKMGRQMRLQGAY